MPSWIAATNRLMSGIFRLTAWRTFPPNEAFFSTLHLLKQRTKDNNFRIDLPKTINASIKKGGMADFQYRQLTRPAEYLLLIDRQSAANHRAQLFNWLYKQFKAQEVLVERFFL